MAQPTSDVGADPVWFPYIELKPPCYYCKSNHTSKTGFQGGLQRYICCDCNKYLTLKQVRKHIGIKF